ncbi:MAG TPA: hypothetical protein VF581_07090 [Flavobacterium sp.]|jgi:hypothetical protein
METHFEGSRGSESMSTPHQRQYDEQNPDNVNHVESNHHDNPPNDDDLAAQVIDHPEDVDSSANTDFEDIDTLESRTPDESASTDPNEVEDKPSFKRNPNL